MGHYASEMPDDDDRYEWRRREQVRTKKRLEESIELLRDFRRAAYTDGVDWELNSILRFYQAKLYELRYIDIDS